MLRLALLFSSSSRSMPTQSEPPQPKVHARVALALLESLRIQDRPEVFLIDEDVNLTMPRRLGLSRVVEAEAQRLTQLARRGGRLDPESWEGLVELVARRPDASTVGRKTGADLARSAPGWVPRFPLGVALRLTTRRCLRSGGFLFGEPVFVGHGYAEAAEKKGLRSPRIHLNAQSQLVSRMNLFPDVILPLLEGFLEGIVEEQGILSLVREPGNAMQPSWLLEKTPVPVESMDPVPSTGVNEETGRDASRPDRPESSGP